MKQLRRAIVVALAAAAMATVSAAPYVPDNDTVVLERLPEATDPSLADLKRLRAAAARTPGDIELATLVARRAVRASRESGDPRYLGFAQAALAPWWAAADAPPHVLVLRATIEQSRHRFAVALADLDRALAKQPGDPHALLTRAAILTVQGRYAEAERDCRALARRVAGLIVVTCAAAPASRSGHADAAYRELALALERTTVRDPGVHAWALSLAAEIAVRDGNNAVAESHFRAALAADPRDAYARGAYADFLLDAGRPREVVALLAQDTKNDPLLLRLALAEARLPDAAASYVTHRADLAARFDAARRRGDSVHAREEARFHLDIDRDPARAVELARANWTVQREPADLRVLVDAARAANDASTLAAASEWMAATRLEDVTLAARLGTHR
jgi:uncharacterized protein (TIGR02996 family)